MAAIMQRTTAVFTFVIAALAAVLLPLTARAHTVSYVTVAASFDTTAKSFSVEMAMEVDPTDDAQLNAEISPEMAASTFATEVLSLYFGDQEINVEPQVELIEPKPEDVDVNFPERRKVIVTLAGDTPGNADYFTLHLSEDNQATVIMIKIVDGKPGRRAEVLYPGEFSTPTDLRPVIAGDPFPDKAVEAGANTAAEAEVDSEAAPSAGAGEADSVAAAAAPPVSPDPWWKSFVNGLTQVLPQGYEMLLVLLVMFFFHSKYTSLLRQMEFFLASLSVSFAVCTFTDFAPAALVDWLPVIVALTIAVLALENLFHSHFGKWRITSMMISGVVFGFWMAQDLGVGFSRDTVIAVFQFVLGITLGTGIVLYVLKLAIGPFRERPWYDKYVAFTASLVALGIALFWVIDRW